MARLPSPGGFVVLAHEFVCAGALSEYANYNWKSFENSTFFPNTTSFGDQADTAALRGKNNL